MVRSLIGANNDAGTCYILIDNGRKEKDKRGVGGHAHINQQMIFYRISNGSNNNLMERRRKRKKPTSEPKDVKSNQLSDFVSAEDVKELKKGKKIRFLDSDDHNDDDIGINIRDEEGEEMGDVDNQEIENFIKKLGLDKYEDQGMSGDEGDDEYQAGDDEDGDDYDHGDEGVSLTSKRNKLDKSKKKKKVSQLGGDAKAGDGTFTAKLKAKKGVKEKKTQQQQQPIQQASVINQKLVVENPVQDEEISSSSALPSRCIIQLTGSGLNLKSAVSLQRIHSFQKLSNNNLTAGSEMKEPSDDTTVSRYADLAKKLYEKEVSIYEKECLREEKSHAEWMKTVVSSGVLADKVAALGMQIQEAPVHTLQYLEQLLAMGKKKGRREAGLAVDALKHLFLEDLLLSREN
ncbi:putative CCAAT/enhancer-binding protein zeta [Apostichopus japonicus]|uniref:Putative CCAAT/enhancer-binding protein zeta n=1 Tax=Stichopus japonicus TaxID=307972 RepID=A0A2G8JG49_STIJA|nr:putative CCAAT/enhancer-binding protein zeta [Apostichopus japonicus]